ncbi:MAG: GIY-YIG nuclease family protein [Candidatus Roizmanbacteria bacterium]
MYYTYILKLNNGNYYAGHAIDLKKRINSHISGSVQSTKNLRPVELVYYSAFMSKRLAIKFEKYLKSSSGFAFRNKHLI